MSFMIYVNVYTRIGLPNYFHRFGNLNVGMDGYFSSADFQHFVFIFCKMHNISESLFDVSMNNHAIRIVAMN